MRRHLGRFLVLLILGIPHLVHADDACELESTYREQLATLQIEREQKASLIEGINSRIWELRSLRYPPDTYNSTYNTEWREEIDGYVNERREIYTDLRLIRDAVKQTSKQLGEAQRECIRSKRRSKSPRPAFTPS